MKLLLLVLVLAAAVLPAATAVQGAACTVSDQHVMTACACDAFKALQMEDAGVTTIGDGVFGGADCADVYYLSFVRDHLQSIGVGKFDGLVGLETLDLSDNALTGVHAGELRGLVALQELYLVRNSIEMVESGAFADLHNLRILQIFSNSLSNLPSDVFAGMHALQRLGLSENSFQGLPATLFRGLTSLLTVNLHTNNLQSLDKNMFQDQRHLEELTLSMNPLVDSCAAAMKNSDSTNYLLNATTDSCVPCAKDTFNSGWSSDALATGCRTCAAGSGVVVARADGAGVCSVCPAGQVTDMYGSVTASDCHVGNGGGQQCNALPNMWVYQGKVLTDIKCPRCTEDNKLSVNGKTYYVVGTPQTTLTRTCN